MELGTLADRANTARRLMQLSGLGPHQVSQIRGYADERLRKKEEPEHPSNRRISVIVQHIVKDLPTQVDPPKNDASPGHPPPGEAPKAGTHQPAPAPPPKPSAAAPHH